MPDSESRDRRAVALEALPPIEREETDGTLRVKRAFRDLTRDQAAGYFESLGGDGVAPDRVVGPVWEATLTTRVDPVGPSYRLTTVTITWTGETSAVEQVVFRFRVRAFRAPG